MEINNKTKLIGLTICGVLIVGAITGGIYVHATQSNQSYIGEEKAKAIALEHAKISENEISFVLSRLNFDDGIAEYEVEFWNGLTEYDYEIDAITGEIRSYDYDMESNISVPQSPPSNNDIKESAALSQDVTQEQAKSIALQDADINDNDINYIKCEFDYDDGNPEYEVEWKIGNMEYEYTISAVDGSILERDIELDD